MKSSSSAQNTSNNEPRFTKKRMRIGRAQCPQISSNHSSLVGLRYCYKIQSSCNDLDNLTTVRNCRDGKTALVSFKNETYKNFNCLKCNHQYSIGLFPAKVSCGPHFGPGSRFDFSSMFRIPTSQHTDTDRCSTGSFYDNIARICRKLLTISELSSDDPSFLTKYAVRLQYTRNHKYKCFAYEGNAYDKNRAKGVILDRLLTGLNEAFMWKIGSYLRKTNWTLSDIDFKVDNTSYTSVTFQILVHNSDIDEAKLFSPVKDLKLLQLNFLYNRYNSSSLCSYSLSGETSRRMECLDKNQSKMIEKDKISVFDNGTLFNRVTPEEFNEGQYMLYKSHNQTRLATCKKSLPTNCKYILESNSSWKLFSNQSIYSNVTNTWFEFGEYSIIDGVAWLCFSERINLKADQSKSKSKTLHKIAKTYSSLICLTISIVSLTVLVFIYSITPSLRNLPGKNLMLLCCVLAMAQLLWLLQGQASKLHKMCIVFSHVMHFLFLASFSSATSIALLHFLTFRAIANGKLGKANVEKPFLRYCLFSLGFPLAWVSAFTLLDYCGIFSLNYGSIEGHCWFGNIRGMYVSFFAPVFTLLCLNFALLLATVNVIRKCSQANQKLAEGVKASVNKNHIWIYIRMATLMGFTWLLGVFQLSFPSVVVFDYLFVFVNGLQGFYIALAFLCTDNIKKVLSKRITSVTRKTKSISN